MKVLCAGAAGSGMGAIVRWHLQLGDEVYVHDDFVEAAELLRKYPSALPWDQRSPETIDLAVFSDAVPQNNPLRRGAIARKIPLRSFAEELGSLCSGRRVIAVAGTHGKSTTTALLSWIFVAAGRNPLCFIGAEIPTWKGNFRYGEGPVIVEADEYRKHFLNLNPEIVVVTSLEMDHFDTYADEDELVGTFADFCTGSSVKSAFVARGQPTLEKLCERNLKNNRSSIRFGDSGDPVYCKNWRTEDGKVAADISLNGAIHRFTFRAAASPHISNVLGAIAVGLAEGISPETMQEAIASFPGILRRLEYLGAIENIRVYSDYAHHATAVRETLGMCRKIWPDAEIGVIFEPHERLRTSRLRSAYENAFLPAEKIGLLPVYEPRGRERAGMSEKMYALSISGDVQRLPDYASAISWAKDFGRKHPKGMLIVMGAGPVDAAFRKALL
jgi:UDP-N-acetylmuramate--alanine ligase